MYDVSGMPRDMFSLHLRGSSPTERKLEVEEWLTPLRGSSSFRECILEYMGTISLYHRDSSYLRRLKNYAITCTPI
jgi:hypothetical protein